MAAVDRFFAAKLEEARQAYEATSFDQARALCEAILTLGPGDAIQVRAKRLLRLARDRAFSDSVLFIDLRPAQEYIRIGEPLGLTLVVLNRSPETVTVTPDPSGLIGQVTVSSTRIAPNAECFFSTAPEDLRAPPGTISIASGESWKHDFTIAARPAEGPTLAERLQVGGRFVPRHIGAGSRTLTRPLRIPLVMVLRLQEGRAAVARDPLESLSTSIETGDAEGLFLGTVLAAWEGEFEGALGHLLTGTGSARAGIAETSYVLLRLLTGENFERDRRKWIGYYLGDEKVPIRGPLAEW